jgi:hypothetical protein
VPDNRNVLQFSTVNSCSDDATRAVIFAHYAGVSIKGAEYLWSVMPKSHDVEVIDLCDSDGEDERDHLTR